MAEKKRKWVAWAGTAISLALFGAAIWFLDRELDKYSFRDIIRSVRHVPLHHLLAALGLTVINYGVLTLYDALAFRYIKRALPYCRLALASFIGYAFNNLGLSAIAGSSLRYRFYMGWGLTAEDVTKVVLFYNLTIWVGLFLLGGFLFFLFPLAMPGWLHLSFQSTRPLGALLLIAVSLYLAASLLHGKRIRLRSWTFTMPSKSMCLVQGALSIAAWMLSASVLYALLSHYDHLTVIHFLELFLLAQTIAIISQVPGGLGVFESVMAAGLRRSLPLHEVLAALMLFRLIYYVLPLILAAGLLGAYELHSNNALRKPE